MPARFRACWGVTAVFWPDDYLIQVARQIRVERVRGPLIAELRDHMLLQKADYMAEGIAEADAERRATEDMGDALLVGSELDAVHRPETPWKGLGLAALLLALGLVLQLAIGSAPDRNNILFTALALAPLLLFAFVDYTFWIRWSLPVLLVWLLMIVQRLWIWVAWGFGPLDAEGFGFLLRSPLFSLLLPQMLAVGLPMVAALLACRLRGRGWGGLAVCLLPVLALGILCWEYRRADYDIGSCALMAALSCGVLALSVREGSFHVRRGAALALLGGLAALAVGFAVSRLRLQPANSEMRRLIGTMLRSARLVGRGAGSAEASEAWHACVDTGRGTADYLLPALVVQWGWLPFAALMLGVAALLGWCIRRFARLENRMGSLLGLAATMTLALQAALYIPASFGLTGTHLCLPMLSRGQVMLMGDAALVGVMLGVLRGQSLPEAALNGSRRSTARLY